MTDFTQEAFPFSNVHAVQTSLILDTANEVYGDNANTSIVDNTPSIIQYSALNGSTSLQIQAKIHIDADWVPIKNVDANSAAGFYVMPSGYSFNFVRVVRTGTGDVVVYSQG